MTIWLWNEIGICAESSDPVELKAGTYEDKTALQLTPAKVTAWNGEFSYRSDPFGFMNAYLWFQDNAPQNVLVDKPQIGHEWWVADFM